MQLHKMTHLEGEDRTGRTAHKGLQEQRPKVRRVRNCENPQGDTSVYPGFPNRSNNLQYFSIHPGLHLGQACPDLEYNRWQTESGCAYLLEISIPLARCKNQEALPPLVTVEPRIKEPFFIFVFINTYYCMCNSFQNWLLNYPPLGLENIQIIFLNIVLDS